MNINFTQVLALSGLLALLLLYKLWRKNHLNSNGGKSAPEASGAWPLIGHLHLLGGQIPVYRIFGGLADKYGPVFAFRLGLHKALVVSSWEAAKECFTTNDKILNKRPPSSAAVHLGYNYAAFAFSHGPYWREVRKLVMQELLSARRLETLKHVRQSEIEAGIRELFEEHSGKVVDIGEWLDQITSNMIMMMVAGKRHTDSGAGTGKSHQSFRELMKEFMYISGQFVPADFIPFPPFKWIDFQRNIKSMKRISKRLSTIFEDWIDEHILADRRSKLGKEQDFIDVLLSTIDDKFARSFGYTRETVIKATIMNIIIAGNDTTSTHMTCTSIFLNSSVRIAGLKFLHRQSASNKKRRRRPPVLRESRSGLQKFNCLSTNYLR
ncbi:cytochrome [Sesamum alatum]|uniref:Cytochrome n=1 Tax=Sesamum alatum TaxID=300844 RepID=A0AAE1Z2A6_9LAMI|nr:cytochrome [Sesamum alatum]